ncbi:hypothetical protein [Streptomyces collinus]|uniref:hypothetical protein n=1 Tax=Streptomyces collinus TaxID=42684 RepID=UPI00362AD3C0
MAQMPAQEPSATLRGIHEAAPTTSGDADLFGVPAGEAASADRFRHARLRLVRGGKNAPEPTA